ncbi:MAG: glycine cleavage system protein GcvH [Bdellovibrionales bacterium]|nr:glycine cleavage system protein GcvH [Bdellovibrionales bacterium]
MRFPAEFKYTKDHEWLKIENKVATIGITDHAQSALGDIVYIDLPKVGRELKEHEVFGVVESIKAVSDLYSPAAGRVIEINSALVADPSQVNRDPHAGAWMIKIELKGEPTGLMSADAYQTYVANLK